MKFLKLAVIILLSTTPVAVLTVHNLNENKVNKAKKIYQSSVQGKNKPKEGKKVPIDGGISALLIAGTAFGVKALAKKSKTSKDNTVA